MHPAHATLFDVHPWIIPTTNCDDPVLAVAQDRSALLSLGDYSLDFDWGIPEEARPWLSTDFAHAGQTLRCDLSRIRRVLASMYPGGAEFGIVRFNIELRPTHLELALAVPPGAAHGAEYRLHGLGAYQRFRRESDRLLPVITGEQSMLDVCMATFAELAAQYGELLRQPRPPRYRPAGKRTKVLGN